jgi:hypothetical protein
MLIKVGLLLTLLLIAITTCQAQQEASLITNIEGRHTTNLNGHWQIIIDLYETGYYDYRYQPSKDGYFKNAKPKSPSDLIEYDFDTSQQLNVPGDWNSQDQRLLFYVSTASDTVVDRIGFRSIETRGTDVLLNGRPVFLRGISIHEESPLRGGRAFSEDDARMLLTWAKELGCNFVRLAIWLCKHSDCKCSSGMTASRIAASCSAGVSPSGDRATTSCSRPSFKPDTRIMKNSSRFDAKMERNFNRSSNGLLSSSASSSTLA